MGIYLWLSLYILSLVTAVLLLAAGKRFASGPLRGFFFIHLAGTLAALAGIGFNLHTGLLPALLILSGLVAGALAARATVPQYLKLYFGLFFLSAAFFILSPSRFGGFLETGRIHVAHPDKFHLYRNVYLEAQRDPAHRAHSASQYKVIREFGLFHKTLRRDIVFPIRPDSVRCLPGAGTDTLVLRIYRVTGSRSVTDSADLTVSLTQPDSMLIRRR
jgi:hypothetical protein